MNISMLEETRRRAFTVAASMPDQVLHEIRNLIDHLLETGEPLTGELAINDFGRIGKLFITLPAW